jgi:hypothetical protein
MAEFIEITFKEIRVGDGGDSSGNGEIGFEIRLNDVAILHRWGNEIVTVGNNASIPLNHVSKIYGNGGEPHAKVYWHAWDVDTVSDDDAGNNTQNFSLADISNPQFINDRLHPIKTFLGSPIDSIDLTLVYEVTKGADITSFGRVRRPKVVNGLTGVRLFEARNFGKDVPPLTLFGPSRQTFSVGFHNLPENSEPLGGVVGGVPDSISQRFVIQPGVTKSVLVGQGFTASAYSELNGGGEKLSITENLIDMPAGWNDRIKSIEVYRIL